MSQLLLRGARLRKLRQAELELAPGRYVVVSNEAEALAELVALSAGRDLPRSGFVLLDGSPPAASPAARRKIAALFQSESLLPETNVLTSVAHALAARGSSTDGLESLLEELGLGHLGKRAPSSLDERETRSIALAIALSHQTAELLALHEPLTTLAPSALVIESLDQHTTRGAIVVCTTTSTADAALLGGSWLCLERGRLDTASAATPRLGAGPWQQLLVEAADASALALALKDSPLALESELGSDPHRLLVTGPALDVTAREVCAVARQQGIEIQRLEAAVPPVEALLAARQSARGAA